MAMLEEQLIAFYKMRYKETLDRCKVDRPKVKMISTDEAKKLLRPGLVIKKTVVHRK